jgi:hypothetical protein
MGAMRHAYVAQTKHNFIYLSRPSAPYLTQEQRVSMESRFALVHSKPDFDRKAAPSGVNEVYRSAVFGTISSGIKATSTVMCMMAIASR